MLGFITGVLAGLSRQVALWFSLGLALIAALAITWRRGRAAGKAAYATRRAEARIRALTTSRDIRHDVETSDPADRDRRLDRWMRD
ncbi:MAG: hypothetical protein WAO78_00035 [Roseovarius sp.]